MQESSSEARGRRIWLGIAAGVFLVALATAFHGYWGADLRTDAPVPTSRTMGASRSQDLLLTAWGTSRNAWTLLHRPARLFDAEPCYPERNSLTTDHPRITLGLVGAPIRGLTDDPVATFNGVVFASVLIAAFAMFLLVTDWTRVPAAGIAAAILYAFSTQQIEKTFHLMHTDNAWLLFALFFARRTLRDHRWRDAIGLGAMAALQAGSSLYSFLAAAAGRSHCSCGCSGNIVPTAAYSHSSPPRPRSSQRARASSSPPTSRPAPARSSAGSSSTCPGRGCSRAAPSFRAGRRSR